MLTNTTAPKNITETTARPGTIEQQQALTLSGVRSFEQLRAARLLQGPYAPEESALEFFVGETYAEAADAKRPRL